MGGMASLGLCLSSKSLGFFSPGETGVKAVGVRCLMRWPGLASLSFNHPEEVEHVVTMLEGFCSLPPFS